MSISGKIRSLFGSTRREANKGSQSLTREIVTTSMTGVRSVWRNPIATGLSPSGLATLLRNAESGYPRDYLGLAEEIEERDGHYSSVLGTRKMAVTGLPLNVEAASDDGQDVKRADLVKTIVERPEFRDVLFHVLDALGKGFSVTEIMWERSASVWMPTDFKWRDPRFFEPDRDDGETLRIVDNTGAAVDLLAPNKFIVHKPALKSGLSIRGGLARKVAALHVFKAYALADWLSFCEIYGIPMRVGSYEKSATADEIAVLKTAVANLGTDAAAVIPTTMKIELVKAETAGSPIHVVLAEWLNKEISKCVLGQTMTTEDGSSLSQAKVHDEVRLDIRNSDARQLAQTINRDLVRPFIALNFGQDVVPPVVSFDVEEAEDLASFTASVVQFIDRGLTVETSVIRDKFGLPEPEPGADVLRPLGGSSEPEPSPADRQREVVANREEPGEDEIDRMVGEIVAARQAQIRRFVGPVLEAVQGATSFEDAASRASAVAPDASGLVDSLAEAMFMARGLGDSKDRP